MILQIGASLGRAIALSGKPDISQAVSIAQRDKERRAATRAAERAVREKEKERLSQDIKNLTFDPTKIHGFDFDPLSVATAQQTEVMRDLMITDPYGNKLNNAKYQKKDLNRLRKINIATQNKKVFDAVQKTMDKNKGEYVLNTENLEALSEGLDTGDYNNLRNKLGDSVEFSDFLTLKAPPAPDWWSKAQKYAPSKTGTKIEEGTTTITNKGANKEANKTRAENIYNFSFTVEEQQEAIRDAGSKEKAIEAMATEMDNRVEILYGRAEDEPKTTLKGWDININGWKNKKYVFKYSSEEKEVFGAKKLDETVFLEYLGTPDLSKLNINIKGLPLEGRITSFKIDERGEWFMQYKTTESHPKIKATQEKGAVTISVPWDDVKTEVEGKYQFVFDTMLNEVRALQGGKPAEKPTEYTPSQQKAIDEAKAKQGGKITQPQLDWILKQ